MANFTFPTFHLSMWQKKLSHPSYKQQVDLLKQSNAHHVLWIMFLERFCLLFGCLCSGSMQPSFWYLFCSLKYPTTANYFHVISLYDDARGSISVFFPHFGDNNNKREKATTIYFTPLSMKIGCTATWRDIKMTTSFYVFKPINMLILTTTQHCFLEWLLLASLAFRMQEDDITHLGFWNIEDHCKHPAHTQTNSTTEFQLCHFDEYYKIAFTLWLACYNAEMVAWSLNMFKTILFAASAYPHIIISVATNHLSDSVPFWCLCI